MDKFGVAATRTDDAGAAADQRRPCDGAGPRPPDTNGRYSVRDFGHLTRMAAIPGTIATTYVIWARDTGSPAAAI